MKIDHRRRVGRPIAPSRCHVAERIAQAVNGREDNCKRDIQDFLVAPLIRTSNRPYGPFGRLLCSLRARTRFASVIFPHRLEACAT